MKVLVIGSGAREHALAQKLAQSPSVREVIAAPGNAGISAFARCLGVGAEDVSAMAEMASREKVDLAIVGPEAPLVIGMADGLRAAGVPTFGPSAAAARLE